MASPLQELAIRLGVNQHLLRDAIEQVIQETQDEQDARQRERDSEFSPPPWNTPGLDG